MAMSYRPRLSEGRLMPMPWQLRFYSINICWPLEANSTLLRRNLDRFIVITVFILFSILNAASINYMIYNMQNIELLMDAVPLYMLLLDVNIRIFSIAFHKIDFRKLLEDFYAKIYIEKESNNKQYRSIKRKLLPTVLHSYLTLSSICGNTMHIVLFINQRRLISPMYFFFDYTPLPIYIPISIVTTLLAIQNISCVIGESYQLATCILHLNARYQVLQKDCQNLYKTLLRSSQHETNLRHFHQSLMRIIQRNVELNEFAAKLQVEYSWRVFIIMSLSSILICVLCFNIMIFGLAPKTFHYIIWLIAKTLDLFILSQLGSKLISTTSEMGSMYYESNWEDVIQHSSNGAENAKLMKLIALAIEMNQRPMYVTGLCFFNISLPTFLSIGESAYTYFSCLYALRYS